MRARSILLSTVLCSGFIMAGAGFAHAETLRPQGSWAVTKVAPKQDGAVPYCALARRFGNGSVLTFARNPSDETSVAVDFPRGTFTKDKNYTVQMDSGFGETRRFELQPVSERGIVIRMGQDEPFYSALEQSGQLTISAEDKSFVFSMPDIKDGVQDLAACITPEAEPAAGSSEATMLNEAAPMQAKAAKEEVMDLTEPTVPMKAQKSAEMEGFTPAPMREPVQAEPVKAPARKPEEPVREAKMKKPMVVAEAPALPAPTPISASTPGSELQTLQEENIRLRNALERERRQYENTMQQSDNSSAAAEMSEKLRILEDENKELRAKTQQVSTKSAEPPTCTPDAAAQDKLAQQIMTLKQENVQLKSDIESQRQMIVSLQSDKSNLADAPVKAVAADDGKLQEMQRQISRLETENKSLKSAMTQQQTNDGAKANIATITQMKSLEAQLASMTSDRNRLAAQIESIQNTEGENRIKLSSNNWDLEQATRRYNEAEREIRRLGLALEQSRAKCEVDKKNLESMLFDPAVAEKEQVARLVDLEEQLAQAKLDSGSKEQIAAYQGQIKDLEQKLASADTEMKQLRVNADIAEQKRAALEDQQAMVNGLKQEIATLNSKVEGQNKAQALEQKLASAEAEMTKMRGAMEESDRARAALLDQQDVVASLKQEISTLNTQIASLQEENRKVSADGVQKEIALKQEITSLTGKLADAQISSQNEAAMTAQLGKLNAELATLRSTSEQSSTANTQKEAMLNGQIADLKEQLAQLKATADQNIQIGTQNENALTAQIAALNAELTTLKSSSTQSTTASAQKEAAMTAQITTLSAQLAAVQTENQRLAAEGNKTEIIDALKQEINSLNTQVTNLQSEKTAIATQLSQISSGSGDRRRAAPAAVQPNVEVTALSSNDTPQSMATTKPTAIEPVERTPVAAVPVPMAAPVQNNPNLMSASDMAGLLRQAGVDVPNVEKIGKPNDNRVAFKWEAKGMYGNAEQRMMDSAGQYDQLVQDYLNKTRTRCAGQFAAVPALVDSVNGTRISAYEIACVDNGGNGASAALVFYSRNGTFVAVAHEAPPESMDVAMDARDKIVSLLESSKLASR